MSRLSLNKTGLPLNKLKDITESGTQTGAIRKAILFTVKYFKRLKTLEKENRELKNRLKAIRENLMM